MQEVLNAINGVNGVIGSALFSSDDQIIAAATTPPFEPILLGQAMQHLRASLDMLSMMDQLAPWESFSITYEAGFVMLRNIDNMSLLALAQPTINQAMLGIALNVATLKIQQRGQMSSSGAYNMAAQGGMTASGTYAPVGPQSGSGQTMASSTGLVSASGSGMVSSATGLVPMSHSGTTSFGLSLSASANGGVAPADAVGHQIMNALLKAFVRQIGPIGKIFFKEEVGRLGVTPGTLGRSQYEDFLVLLVARIPEASKRQEFLREAAKIG